MSIILFISMLFSLHFLAAQDYSSNLKTLDENNIELDSTDRSWLTKNSSLLIDISSLVKVDSTAMNRAIIQMSTKLLSNKLTEITEDEAKHQKELISEIIYGSLDAHGLKDEKLLSAMSWYNMIVNEIRI